MKKFLKLALAVAALTTIFGFASCSNDSSNDSTAPAATATPAATAAATASVTELKYTDAELAGKKFSYKKGGNTKYYIFTDGKCYDVDDANATIDSNTKTSSPVIVKYNGNLYKVDKYTIKSGTGLYATWDMGNNNSLTLKSDGSGTLVMNGGSTNITFTNNSGVVTASGTHDGQLTTMTYYYDGSNLYQSSDKGKLTFAGNYTPSNS